MLLLSRFHIVVQFNPRIMTLPCQSESSCLEVVYSGTALVVFVLLLHCIRELRRLHRVIWIRAGSCRQIEQSKARRARRLEMKKLSGRVGGKPIKGISQGHPSCKQRGYNLLMLICQYSEYQVIQCRTLIGWYKSCHAYFFTKWKAKTFMKFSWTCFVSIIFGM